MAVLYFHHFLHWRADEAVGKITPIVALGERRARVVGAVLLSLVAATILFDAILNVSPWYSFIAALTVIPILNSLRHATGDLKSYLKLMAANLNGDLQAALIIVVALLIRGFTHL
jgi:1,4-dihydroxy-2-naphthoate octaprenyltransferase